MEESMRLLKVAALMIIIALSVSTTLLAQGSKKLIFSNFKSDPENVETHIIISDVDGVGPNVKISIYNEEGRLVYERYETLKAFGKLNYNPVAFLNAYQQGYNQNPKFRGTIRMESDGGNIIAQYLETTTAKVKLYAGTAICASNGEGYTNLTCQHFVSEKGVDAGIFVSNLETDRSVKIYVKFYSDNGGLLATENQLIQPNGMAFLNPYKITKGLRSSGTAYISVVGAGKIVGEYWQTPSGERNYLALPLDAVSKVR
jgi:hypothetical protein